MATRPSEVWILPDIVNLLRTVHLSESNALAVLGDLDQTRATAYHAGHRAALAAVCVGLNINPHLVLSEQVARPTVSVVGERSMVRR